MVEHLPSTHTHSWVPATAPHRTIIPGLGRSNEGQEFKAILSSTANPRSALVTWNCLTKRKSSESLERQRCSLMHTCEVKSERYFGTSGSQSHSLKPAKRTLYFWARQPMWNKNRLLWWFKMSNIRGWRMAQWLKSHTALKLNLGLVHSIHTSRFTTTLVSVPGDLTSSVLHGHLHSHDINIHTHIQYIF